MKSLLAVFCCLLIVGCAAKRTSTGNNPPAPVTTWEQVNYDNLQIAVHNRAIAKAMTAAQQAGLLETGYYDTISREGISITQLHKQLTPLLKDEATAKTNADKVKTILSSIVTSASTIATVASVKNPQSKQSLITEAQLVQSLASSILSLLQSSGVISERRRYGPDNRSESRRSSCGTCSDYHRGLARNQAGR